MPNFYNIINTIREESDQAYQDRIPVVTKSNMQDVGYMLTSNEYKAEKNTFLDALVFKVAFVDVMNRRWKNPLAVLKNGTRPYGGFKEVAHTNPVKGKDFTEGDGSDLFTTEKPDVKTAYFRRNRQQKYPVSISNAQLRTAFSSPAEFGKMYQSIINAMYSGDEMDEYLLMRNGLSACIADGRVKTIGIDYEANPADLIKSINTISRLFKYERDDFAGYNQIHKSEIEAGSTTPCITWTPTERQVLLIREDVDVNTDIEVLAKAFNMDKTNFATRKIGIDSFSDSSILCVLADESFFEFEDEEYTIEDFRNGSNLTTKYFLHHWETIQFNGLANAVAFKQEKAEAATA